MKNCWLVALAFPLIALSFPLRAAAPPRQLTLSVPSNALPQPPGAALPGPRFEPAPLPNRDLAGPSIPRASTETTLAPTVFSSHEQFRGDGFSRYSSAQIQQDRNVKPPVGFSLHMPFTPQ